jgi:hypothetical protein
VPGVWVEAPYQGALWTPGYWGYTHNHYGFFHGYWGPHIGFYGGVNYGFGYVGTGYQGGYWNSGHFYYNRAVNNINVSIVHNVYEHPVPQVSVRQLPRRSRGHTATAQARGVSRAARTSRSAHGDPAPGAARSQRQPRQLCLSQPRTSRPKWSSASRLWPIMVCVL